MVTVVVFVTNDSQSEFFIQRHKSREVQRRYTHGNCDYIRSVVWWINTPRTCMLRSVAAVLYRSPDRGWDVGS